jgi:hypothetical protein
MRDLADQASVRADQIGGPIGEAKHWILDTFGQNGLYAAYIILAALVLLVISKLVGLTFSAVKYMVIPAIVLAFLATIFLPYSFFVALPVTATVCSLFMLFKG